MRGALYYPHTTIRSEELLKTSLLLWDKVTVIAPWDHFRAGYTDRVVEEAVELIAEYHYPSDDEKTQAHKLIEDLITRPLPKLFYLVAATVRAELTKKKEVRGAPKKSTSSENTRSAPSGVTQKRPMRVT